MPISMTCIPAQACNLLRAVRLLQAAKQAETARGAQPMQPTTDALGRIIHIDLDEVEGQDGSTIDELFGHRAEATLDGRAASMKAPQTPVSKSCPSRAQSCAVDEPQPQKHQVVSGLRPQHTQQSAAGMSEPVSHESKQIKPVVLDLTQESENDTAEQTQGAPSRKRVFQGNPWACAACTLLNRPDVERCGACDCWRYSRKLVTPLDS